MPPLDRLPATSESPGRRSNLAGPDRVPFEIDLARGEEAQHCRPCADSWYCARLRCGVAYRGSETLSARGRGDLQTKRKAWRRGAFASVCERRRVARRLCGELTQSRPYWMWLHPESFHMTAFRVLLSLILGGPSHPARRRGREWVRPCDSDPRHGPGGPRSRHSRPKPWMPNLTVARTSVWAAGPTAGAPQ